MKASSNLTFSKLRLREIRMFSFALLAAPEKAINCNSKAASRLGLASTANLTKQTFSLHTRHSQLKLKLFGKVSEILPFFARSHGD